MRCTCGHILAVDASSRDEAVKMIQEMETEEEIKQHMAELHPGEPVPTKEQVNLMVAQEVKEGDQDGPHMGEQAPAAAPAAM